MSEIFFSSDFHFQHKNICHGSSSWPDKHGTRDFLNADLMSKQLVENINSKISSQDILYFLGDWSFANKNNVERYRSYINCRDIRFILGNHDKYIMEYQKLFTWVKCYHEEKIANTFFVMMHYPIISFNHMRHGTVHTFGHCHGSMNQWLESYAPQARMLDVGVDTNDMQVYHISEVLEKIKNKSGKTGVDHHD